MFKLFAPVSMFVITGLGMFAIAIFSEEPIGVWKVPTSIVTYAVAFVGVMGYLVGFLDGHKSSIRLSKSAEFIEAWLNAQKLPVKHDKTHDKTG